MALTTKQREQIRTLENLLRTLEHRTGADWDSANVGEAIEAIDGLRGDAFDREAVANHADSLHSRLAHVTEPETWNRTAGLYRVLVTLLLIAQADAPDLADRWLRTTASLIDFT